MEITARTDANRLLVDVRIRNEFEERIYLAHWLLDWYGLLGIPEMHAVKSQKTARRTRELAYVCTGAPGEVVLLNGDGPGFPPGIAPTVPRLPLCSRLDPQATLQWTLTLPVPLCEWYAYEPPLDQPTRPVRAETLRYRLEVLRASRCRGTPKEHPSYPGVFYASGNTEVFEASAALEPAVIVLQRTDSFRRFAH